MDDKDPVCFRYRVRFNSFRMNDLKGLFTLCDVRLRLFLWHGRGCVDVNDTVQMVRLQYIFVCDVRHRI